MKMLVTQRDGTQEVVVLQPGRWTVIQGTTMNRIRNDQGFEYYFFRRDGAYDGWGKACGSDCTVEEAKSLLDAGSPREDADD